MTDPASGAALRGAVDLSALRNRPTAPPADGQAAAEAPVVPSLVMDVTDEGQVEAGMARTVERWGCLDILVSNAGIQHIDPLSSLALADWRRLLAIHLDGAFLTSRAAMRIMSTSGRGGSIILMGSVMSVSSSPLKAPYVTAKHGLVGLCQVIAREGAALGVRCNIIEPGFVRTEMTRRVQDSGMPAFAFVPKERVVRESLTAWAAGRSSVVPGAQYKTASGILRFLPKPVVRAAARRFH